MTKNNTNKKSLNYLIDIMATLRGPNGCPWDKEQTIKTLAPHTLEEAYEVLDALDTIDLDKGTGDYQSLKEELGDLLFQIVFACQMTSETDKFDIGDVIETVGEKMIRRHPHVFEGGNEGLDAKEVLSRWHDIKEKEKASKDKKKTGYLADVAVSLPALIRANKVSEKTAKVGYDWTEIEQIFDKVDEEIDEFKEALASGDKDHIEEEMGDCFFALVNLARFAEVDSEEALRKSTDKFIRRFHYIEENLKSKGSNLKEATLDEMEELWEEAKQKV